MSDARLARLMLSAAVGVALTLAGGAPAGAQATRTWVSGVGDDANPCSRTAPCKTFAGAISKTAAAGEINVLDPGGYGAVTVTKSISIVSDGATGGVLVSGSNGIIVNAGANDVVVLRGLDFEGVGAGLNAIRYLAGAALHIEDSTINGFRAGTGHGVDAQLTAAGELYLQNVEIRNGSGAGLFLKSTDGGSPLKATINNSRIENNNVGLDARDYTRVAIRDSAISGNSATGVQVGQDAGGATTEVSIESTAISANTTGIQAGNGTGTSTVRLSNSLVVGNVTGVNVAGGSQLLSFGNNMLAGNSNDGAPSGTIPLR